MKKLTGPGLSGTGSFASLFFLVLLLACLPAAGISAQSAENLFEAGKKAFRDGLYVMAARNFRQLAQEFPDSPLADDAEFLSGVSDFYLGEFRSSIATLQGYTRRYPNSANNRRVSYWLGSAYFQLKDYHNALRHLQAQVDNHPEEQPYFDHSLLLKGMVEENLGEMARARSSYRRLIERPGARSLWPEALYRSGGIDLRLKNYAEALTAFSRILVEFPSSAFASEAVFFTGESSYFLGRYPEAERSYRSILNAEAPLEQRETALFRLASILSSQGRSSQALGFCEELETRFPRGRYQDVLARLKADLLFDLQRYGEAFDAYRSALAAAASQEERQIVYYNLGLSACLAGRVAEALGPLESALAGEASIAEKSLYRLAVSLSELGRFEEAIARFEEFRARFPSSPQREETLRQLGSLYQGSGRLAEAEEAYTQLLARYPYSERGDEYLFRRGSARLERGDSPAALKDFFSLAEKWPASPHYAENQYNIGYIYSQRGEYKRALPYFAAVLEREAGTELSGRAILASGVCLFNAGEYRQALEWFGRAAEDGTAPRAADRPQGRAEDGTAPRAADRPQGRAEGAEVPWVGESWYYLGRTHYKLDQLEEAAAAFARAALMLSDTAQGEEALFWQGLCQFRLNQLAAAKKTFLSLTSRYANGQRLAESYYRAGMCAALSGAHQESIRYFDRALSASAAQPAEYRIRLNQEILFQKGSSYLKAGERGQATATFESLARDYPASPLAAEAFFKMAEEDYRAASYARARTGFQQVIERYPRSSAAAAALYWAGASASRSGDRSAALDYLLRYLEAHHQAGSPDGGGLAEVAVREIRSILAAMSSSPSTGAEEQRVFEEFYRRVERSSELSPSLKNQVRFEYARYIFTARPEEAMAILQKVRAAGVEEPLRSEVSYLIGEHYRRRGELERAQDVFSGITATSSGWPGAASQLGLARVLEAQNRRAEAAEEYLKVYFIYPDQRDLAAEGLYRAGRLNREQGRREEAQQLFDRLRREFPDSPWIGELPQP